MPKLRKLYPIECETCGSSAMKRKGARFCSKSCSVRWQRANCEINYSKGSDHYAWKDDLSEYKSIHMRVNRLRGSANHCIYREERSCSSIKYEWAHIHGTDPIDPYNYISLCKSCHIGYDNQRGEGHSSAKLTNEQAEGIRNLYRGGMSQQAIADRFGLHQTTVSRIVRNVGYRAA